MNQLQTQGSPEATNELWSLANGPNMIVKLYSGCSCNGIRYHTRDRDNRRITQNSGLVVQGDNEGQMIDFYGKLCKVWEMTCLYGHKVVLFQCEWFNTSSRKTMYIDAHVTSTDVRSWWYQSDPFVLPSNVQQVFYVNDTKFGAHWQVVQRVQHRGVWDVSELDDDDDEPNSIELAIPNDAFQQDETTEAVPIVVEDTNYQYCRDDIDPEIIPSDRVMYLGRREHINFGTMGEDGDDEDETMVENRDDEED